MSGIAKDGALLLKIGNDIDVTDAMVRIGEDMLLQSDLPLHPDDLPLFMTALYRAMELERQARQSEAAQLLRAALLFS